MSLFLRQTEYVGETAAGAADARNPAFTASVDVKVYGAGEEFKLVVFDVNDDGEIDMNNLLGMTIVKMSDLPPLAARVRARKITKPLGDRTGALPDVVDVPMLTMFVEV
jgi:hypothetical protein